jgi:hypothetical protein
MVKRSTRVRSTAAFSVVASSVFFLAGCGKVNLNWNEQVELSDGKRVLVKRTAKGDKLGEIGGPGGWTTKEMTVEIISPEVADKPGEWRARWVPMLIDRDSRTREWFVVATFYTCVDWYDLGRPALPYMQYTYRSGAWVQTELQPTHYGRPANLLTGPRSDGEDALVTIEAKQQREYLAAPKYRTVLSKWKTSC